tara:strand:+ start:3089 stop:4057 length:969 start_codon:yes stop_codon:yes gene_type:complete
MHNIAFFSEVDSTGKVPRNYENMRTEYAWYVALDSTHHFIGKLPELSDKMYDLGVVIIPKTNIEQLMQFPLIEQMRRVCKNIGFMQEGPHWYFQDYPMEQQIWYFNTLMEMDVIFAHNKSDVNYYKGLTGKKHIYQNKSLMITDEIKSTTKPEDRKDVIIGGNMCRWYGGFDSYIVAQEFEENIYAPSMGRKIDREDEVGINHLPYMNWIEWMNNLSRFKYGVHLMPTHAAGTFALNCAYHGIPCIGYRGSDTQSELHPLLTVDNGDVYAATKLAKKLKEDNSFYTHCSQQTILIYKNSGFVEESYIYNMEQILKEVMNESN